MVVWGFEVHSAADGTAPPDFEPERDIQLQPSLVGFHGLCIAWGVSWLVWAHVDYLPYACLPCVLIGLHGLYLVPISALHEAHSQRYGDHED